MRVRQSRGFVLLTAALGLVLLVGVAGLVVDLGRLYIAGNELQAAADAAAVAGAYELDGTREGIERAAAQARSNPNRWNFGTQAPEFAVAFAASPDGPFVPDPPAPEGIRYLRVRVRASVPTYFVPAVSAWQSLEASAGAGQTRTEVLQGQWIPYAADAIDPRDPDFGYRAGRRYPLRPVDIGVRRGPYYHDAIRDAIVNGVSGRPLAPGRRLTFVTPDWETAAWAFEERVAQDADPDAETYTEYSGNGRRLLVAPVNDPASDTVIGFAGFFLPSAACGEEPGTPCRAEYVGAALLPGRKGAGPAGVYRVALIQ